MSVTPIHAKSALEVNCPTCKSKVKWEPAATFKPFCSDRCRLIDLGEWASESHKIAGETAPEFTVEGETTYD